MSTQLPEPDINTASHINTRIVGYTADKVRQYAAEETKRLTAELQAVTVERDAQRKVLEQALEALQRIIANLTEGDFISETRLDEGKAAITAIQGVLKS